MASISSIGFRGTTGSGDSDHLGLAVALRIIISILQIAENSCQQFDQCARVS